MYWKCEIERIFRGKPRPLKGYHVPPQRVWGRQPPTQEVMKFKIFMRIRVLEKFQHFHGHKNPFFLRKFRKTECFQRFLAFF